MMLSFVLVLTLTAPPVDPAVADYFLPEGWLLPIPPVHDEFGPGVVKLRAPSYVVRRTELEVLLLDRRALAEVNEASARDAERHKQVVAEQASGGSAVTVVLVGVTTGLAGVALGIIISAVALSELR